MLADKGIAPVQDPFETEAVQQLALAGQAQAAFLDAALHHPRQTAIEFPQRPAHAVDPVADQGRAQARRDRRKAITLFRTEGHQGPVQPLGPFIQALAGQGQQLGRAAQAAGQAVQVPPPLRQAPAQTKAQAAVQILYVRHQFRAHRHGDLGRRRGGWRPAVGDKVDQSGIGLVPHGRDQGDLTVRHGAGHDFFVKGPQILDGAAATGHDD